MTASRSVRCCCATSSILKPPSPAMSPRKAAPQTARWRKASTPRPRWTRKRKPKGPNLSLSALEEKLKPEVLAQFEEIEALYKKLHKMQIRRLESITSGEDINETSD